METGAIRPASIFGALPLVAGTVLILHHFPTTFPLVGWEVTLPAWAAILILVAWGLAVLALTRIVDGGTWNEYLKQAYKKGYAEGWKRRESSLARTVRRAVQAPSSVAFVAPVDPASAGIDGDTSAPASTDGGPADA